MTQYIKAPFNFVPLNEKVFFPDWADEVSHDIPVSNGESGEIELELEAMTPVFVRNGHTQEEAKDKSENYVSFSKSPDGNYFIPGTSVKGMIRNVLEIMSFGKMYQISNDRYGFRDLSNNKDYMPLFQGGKVHCGFMKKINNNEIEIIDHGVPYRISHEETDRKLNIKLANFCASSKNFKIDINRTARKKHQLLDSKISEYTFKEDTQIKKPKVDVRKFVKFDDNGDIKGTLVLTGQPGERKKRFNPRRNKYEWTGKFYEFVFPSKPIGKETLPIRGENDLRFKDFLFIHKDSSDWTDFRKKQFENKKLVPLFFVKDNQGKILHFGLSYLYKIPYNKRVKDCLYENHKKNSPDLADLIFGNQNLGLKGKVQFSNAKLLAGETGGKIEPLMGSPKASYYPIYLAQNSTNGFLNDKFYQTYSSNEPILKGWKRYPAHEIEIRTFDVDEKQKQNTSPFIPLKAGSKFSLKIRFHNLKTEEIGALLVSLSLNDSGGFHSLGFAKPYGYGMVKLSIKSQNWLNNQTEYISSFKKVIEKEIPNWEKSRQIQELLLMTKPQKIDKDLRYMTLSEFADAKSAKKNFGNKLVLPYFSEYIRSGKMVNRSLPNNAFKHKLQNSQIQKQQQSKIQENKPPKIDVQPDWMKAVLIGEKKVKLLDLGLETAMVIPIEKRNISLKTGDRVWVKPKQFKKDGTLHQVEFIAKI